MSLTKLSLAGYNKIFPGQGEFGLTSRLPTGKSLTFFHNVDASLRRNLTVLCLNWIQDTARERTFTYILYIFNYIWLFMDHWTRVRGTEYFIQNGEFLIRKEGEGGRPFIQDDVQRLFSFNLCLMTQVKYGIIYPKFIWASVYSCTYWLRPLNSPLPPHFGSYTRTLLVSQDRPTLLDNGHISEQSGVFCWRLPNILKNEINALIGWGNYRAQ